jgi:hypothetical protein
MDLGLSTDRSHGEKRKKKLRIMTNVLFNYSSYIQVNSMEYSKAFRPY